MGILALFAVTSPAVAQPATAPKLFGAEQTHTTLTGLVSLETSRVAISKATARGVKRFAQVESAEQETVAAVLKALAGLDDKAKPPMTAEGKAAIDKLLDIKTGAEFDKANVADQIDEHQKLLQIQEAYLSAGKGPTSTAIAMLARGQRLFVSIALPLVPALAVVFYNKVSSRNARVVEIN